MVISFKCIICFLQLLLIRKDLDESKHEKNPKINLFNAREEKDILFLNSTKKACLC